MTKEPPLRDTPQVPLNGWTARELAEYLDIGLRTVRRYTHVWPHHRVAGRWVRFMADDVAQIRDLWFMPVPINQQTDNPADALTRLREQRQKRVS